MFDDVVAPRLKEYSSRRSVVINFNKLSINSELNRINVGAFWWRVIDSSTRTARRRDAADLSKLIRSFCEIKRSDARILGRALINVV